MSLSPGITNTLGVAAGIVANLLTGYVVEATVGVCTTGFCEVCSVGSSAMTLKQNHAKPSLSILPCLVTSRLVFRGAELLCRLPAFSFSCECPCFRAPAHSATIPPKTSGGEKKRKRKSLRQGWVLSRISSHSGSVCLERRGVELLLEGQDVVSLIIYFGGSYIFFSRRADEFFFFSFNIFLFFTSFECH